MSSTTVTDTDTNRVLRYYGIQGDYAKYLKQYFRGVWIAGDGYCYYDAVYQGVLEGLSLRERETLRLNNIRNKKDFYRAIATFFEDNVYDGNKVNITYKWQRRKQSGEKREKKEEREERKTEITLSPQEISSLRAKTLSCADSDSYGSSHSNELIKAFFYEKFRIDVEINELIFFNNRSQEGWRWTKKNGTRLKVYPTTIKHVFILTKPSTKHYSLLVPKRAPDDRDTLVLLRYSFDDKVTATVAGGEVIDLENFPIRRTFPSRKRMIDMVDSSSSSSESSSSESSSSESSSSESSTDSDNERKAKRTKATHTFFISSDEESDEEEAKKKLYKLKF